MTQTDMPQSDEFRAPFRASAFQWVVRILFGLCLLAIVIVLLSVPAVTARVQGVVDDMGDTLELSDAGRQDSALPVISGAANTLAPVAANSDGNAPSVSAMPQNRIPVRRGGALISN